MLINVYSQFPSKEYDLDYLGRPHPISEKDSYENGGVSEEEILLVD